MLHELGEIARQRELYDIHTLVAINDGDHDVQGIGLVNDNPDYWFVDGDLERNTGSYEFLSLYDITYSQTTPDNCGVWTTLWMDAIRDYVERHPNLPTYHIVIPCKEPNPTLDRPSGEKTCIAAIHDNPQEDYWLLATDEFPPTPRTIEVGPHREQYNNDKWGTSWVYRYEDSKWESEIV